MKDPFNQLQSQKFHLGIYVVIENEGRILLVKKTRGPYSGMWDLPGGKPQHGESISQTLKRETMEETGVNLKDAVPLSNLAFVVNYFEDQELVSLHHTCLVYKALDYDASQMKEFINQEDVSRCSWIEFSSLKNIHLSKVASSILPS